MTEQTESTPAAQPARRVVVAEDETLIRLDIIEILKGEGYDVVGEADNGEKAVQLAEELKPDLVLMDVKMPVMDGIVMLRKLREDAGLKRTPVIMLTAESGPESLATVARLGVRDYVTKPFREEELLAKVGRIIPLIPRAAQ